MGNKPGPKTDNPKKTRISLKIDEKSNEILEKYSIQESISVSEAVRRGIYKLEDDLKK